jgi:hypothetical protein
MRETKNANDFRIYVGDFHFHDDSRQCCYDIGEVSKKPLKKISALALTPRQGILRWPWHSAFSVWGFLHPYIL